MRRQLAGQNARVDVRPILAQPGESIGGTIATLRKRYIILSVVTLLRPMCGFQVWRLRVYRLMLLRLFHLQRALHDRDRHRLVRPVDLEPFDRELGSNLGKIALQSGSEIGGGCATWCGLRLDIVNSIPPPTDWSRGRITISAVTAPSNPFYPNGFCPGPSRLHCHLDFPDHYSCHA